MGAPPPGQGGFRVKVEISPPQGWDGPRTDAFWNAVKDILNKYGKEVGDATRPERPLFWQKVPVTGPQKGYLAKLDPNSTAPNKFDKFAEDYKRLRAELTSWLLAPERQVLVDEWSKVTYFQGGDQGSLAQLWNAMRSFSRKRKKKKPSKGKGAGRKSGASKKRAR